MELSIGENIRRLRRERELTQEEVAAHLGISFQAISKWERGDGYPDITILPAIASYFGVTADELLGMDRITAARYYDELNRSWQENRVRGMHAENVALMEEGLRRFPNDALLMVQLSSSLWRLGGEENMRRAVGIEEQIINHTPDSEVRAATMYNICHSYLKLGMADKARNQAEKLPNLYKSRENMLAFLTEGQEKRRIALDALRPLAWSLALHMKTLAEADGKVMLDRAAKILDMMLECTGDEEIKRIRSTIYE